MFDGAAADAHDEMLAYDDAADDEVAAAALLLSQKAPNGNYGPSTGNKCVHACIDMM